MQSLEPMIDYLAICFFAIWLTAGLKLLRRKFGRLGYWPSMAAVCAGLVALGQLSMAVVIGSMVLLIGVFSELEEMGFSLSVSAFFTLVINGLISAGGFAIWTYVTGPRWLQLMTAQVDVGIKPYVEAYPEAKITALDILLMLPSTIVIWWMGALFLAIVLENRVLAVMNREPQPMRRQLNEIRMPDSVVWLFIVSLLGHFGKFGNETVNAIASNVFFVCTVLFIIQGIAVVARFFQSMRLSVGWQTFFSVLIVIYLFPLVGIVGLADYWFDFRARLAKPTEEEFNRET